MALKVTNPLRILILQSTTVQEPSRLKDKETISLNTRYYEASVPIWRDDLPLSTQALETWENEWSVAEATEVVDAIGAWIVNVKATDVVGSIEDLRNTLVTVQRTIENQLSSSQKAPDPLFILLADRSSSTAPGLETGEWEDVGIESGGWEFIDGSPSSLIGEKEQRARSVNEYGEKIGLSRLWEALEARIWDAGGEREDPDPDIKELEETLDQIELDDTGEALRDLKKGLLSEQRQFDLEPGDVTALDTEVQALESMLAEMQAVKDAVATLPADDRKKAAARAVAQMLKSR